MSPWITALIIYWTLSVLVPMSTIWFTNRYCEDNQDDWHQIVELFHDISVARRFVFVIGLLLVFPITFPYLVYHYAIIWNGCATEIRELNKIQRSHREHVFRTIHPANLPKEVEDHFDEQTPAFMQLGFHLLGNFQLKEDPLGMRGRCFRGLEGVVFGTIVEMDSRFSLSFESIFQDGFTIETATEDDSSLHDLDGSGAYLVVLTGRESTVSQTLDAHLDAINHRMCNSGKPLLRFEDEQLCEVYQYEGRLYSQLLFERGKKDAAPPTPEIPPGIPVFEMPAVTV